MEHSGAHADRVSIPYNINFLAEPTRQADTAWHLSFVVTEQRVGEPIHDFEPLHDRLMHLIIVDQSLSYFAHVHPAFESGAFRVSHIFPSAGDYKLWAEVKPAGADPVLAAFRLTVTSGVAVSPKHADSSRYRVSLTPMSAPLHEAVELTFHVAGPEDRPVTDLEPLMAAGGHCVIISADLRDFLHVHPLEDVPPTWRGGPEVRFLTSFHRLGRYKAWGQFQHRGELITAPFDLDVTSGSHG